MTKGNDVGFHTRDSCGFNVTFENGFTVSVQFGFGTYSANKTVRTYDSLERKVDCADAEVAVLYPTGGFVPISDGGYADDIVGWVKPDQLAVLMAIVAQFPANKKFTHEPLMFRKAGAEEPTEVVEESQKAYELPAELVRNPNHNNRFPY